VVAIICQIIRRRKAKEALDGTEYHYGEFGKDVRVDDVAITKDTLKTAQDDYAACM